MYCIYFSKGICYRCVVIHEKHINVLQYKESKYSRNMLRSLSLLPNTHASFCSPCSQNSKPVLFLEFDEQIPFRINCLLSMLNSNSGQTPVTMKRFNINQLMWHLIYKLDLKPLTICC